MKEELLKDLTEEQIEKVRNCANADEIVALAKKEGIQLTEEQLAAVNGRGCSASTLKCPECGSTDFGKYNKKLTDMPGDNSYYKCNKCGHRWKA